jgi:hypothetical protein
MIGDAVFLRAGTERIAAGQSVSSAVLVKLPRTHVPVVTLTPYGSQANFNVHLDTEITYDPSVGGWSFTILRSSDTEDDYLDVMWKVVGIKGEIPDNGTPSDYEIWGGGGGLILSP